MHVNACQRFRLEQTEALEALITGKKVLTILLTGFGKNPICWVFCFTKILSIDFFSLIFSIFTEKEGILVV